jgi:hypothetical protein
MTVSPNPHDVDVVLRHVGCLGIEPREVDRRYSHIGGLITDAALQPRTKYRTVVLPRIQRVVAEWPDADVLSGFLYRLETRDLAEFLRWKRTSRKLGVIEGLATTLRTLGVETVTELRACYDGADCEQQTRRALRHVKFVGPKTIDYMAILAGSTQHVAVYTHIAGFVCDAGVPGLDYHAIGALITQVADKLGCSTGALDAAIWTYMSTRKTRQDNAHA